MDPVHMTVNILQDAFGEVPVSTEVPWGRDRPERLVVVSMEGGAPGEFLLTPLMGITCWGQSDHDAMTMATYAIDSLRTAAETDPYLSAVDVESLQRDEWTATGQARYYATARLYINTDE